MSFAHPSLSADAGVVVPVPLDLKFPYDLSCASFAFCSWTSARRLRKSDRFTRPTVWDLRRSSADAVWLVKDFGVEVRDGGSDNGGIVALTAEDPLVGQFVKSDRFVRSISKLDICLQCLEPLN